jgi:hypothetical protein
MAEFKKCIRCGESKPIEEFFKNCGGNKRHLRCKRCDNIENRERARLDPERYARYAREERYRKGERTPLSEAKNCASYLGVYIAERALANFFDNITKMPTNNPGFDFVCGRGFKIDVKSSCLIYYPKKTPRWKFATGHNDITDYFLCLAFDNRENLEPQHVWLIPSKDIRSKTAVVITNGDKWMDPWKQYERPMNRVLSCCNQMRSAVIE